MPVSIPLPTIKLGKRKERSLMCEILTADGRWVDRELPAEYSCVVDIDKRIAWLIDPDNQFMAEDEQWHQVLSEKCAIPLALLKTNIYTDGKNDIIDFKNLENELWELTRERKKAEEFQKIKKGDMANKIQWIVTFICCTMIVLAGMHYLWG